MVQVMDRKPRDNHIKLLFYLERAREIMCHKLDCGRSLETSTRALQHWWRQIQTDSPYVWMSVTHQCQQPPIPRPKV